MPRRAGRFGAVGLAVVVVTAVAAVVWQLAASDDRVGSIELGGMSMSDARLDAMSERTMGARLADVPIGAPSPTDRRAAVDDGTLVGSTRRFELTAAPLRWTYRDHDRVAAWAYNGTVPGPVLYAMEGERVQVVVHNELEVATTVHWHGVDVPWREDGVPGVTQQAIPPGRSFTYTFPATPAGTRWYHSHGSGAGDEATQLDMGLSGALVIIPRDDRAPDVDRTFVLDDWGIGARGYNVAMMGGGAHADHAASYNLFTINGRAAPDVPPIEVRSGQLVRLRFVNASTMSVHPMHLHGHQFAVVALDGNPVADPLVRNVVTLQPGETADVEFVADNPGVWMLHCHDLHHADAGMHMLLRYRGYAPVGSEPQGTGSAGDADGADPMMDADMDMDHAM